MGFDPQQQLQQRQQAARRKADAEQKAESLEPAWPYVVIPFPMDAFGIGDAPQLPGDVDTGGNKR